MPLHQKVSNDPEAGEYVQATPKLHGMHFRAHFQIRNNTALFQKRGLP